MATAMRKDEDKGAMPQDVMDELLADAREQYDWIK